MNDLFMKLLWQISDMGNIKSLNLYKSGDYANVLLDVGGKLYAISMRDETEEIKNDFWCNFSWWRWFKNEYF